jgi:hypothetical protein
VQNVPAIWRNLPKPVQHGSLGLLALISLGYLFTTDAEGTEVTIMDRGLNMPIETLTLPSGWELTHDVATDPNTGQFSRYRVEKRGPSGEITRSLPPALFGNAFGVSFEQVWQRTAYQALTDMLQNVTLGSLQTQGPLLSKIGGNAYMQQTLQQSGITELYEVDVSGQRAGTPYEGKLLIAVMRADQQNGVMTLGILLSPQGGLIHTIDTDLRIAESRRANPKHTQAVKQISQQVTQGIQASHKQRMQANQQRFDAHQKMMQGRYQQNDQQNQQWLNNFRNDSYSGSGSNSGYSGQDAYVDSIHEQNTFYDPDSGQNVSPGGQSDYNYTDGLGNFYGTDDPSFNPNSMQGDWQQVKPLRPNY